jgi:hypothetical protein
VTVLIQQRQQMWQSINNTLKLNETPMEAQCHTLKTYVGMKKINKNVFELD